MSTKDEMATEQPEVEDFTDEPVEAAQEPQDAPEQPEEDHTDEEPEDDTKGGKEAAKYRRRLRETEAERDTLLEQVDTLRRSVVDSIVTERGDGGRMHSPDPFWAGGVELADLLDEDGNVDRERVLAACDDVAKRFGISRRPKPGYVPLEGSNPDPGPRTSMVDVVRGKR